MDTSAWLQIRRDRVAYAKATGLGTAHLRRDLEEITVVQSALHTEGEAVASSIAHDFDVAAVRELRATLRRANRQLSLWNKKNPERNTHKLRRILKILDIGMAPSPAPNSG